MSLKSRNRFFDISIHPKLQEIEYKTFCFFYTAVNDSSLYLLIINYQRFFLNVKNKTKPVKLQLKNSYSRKRESLIMKKV
jgi:hypothetical protein